MAFFLCEVELCRKDIAVNHLKILVLKKNLNLRLKKNEESKKKSKKKQINTNLIVKLKIIGVFFEF